MKQESPRPTPLDDVDRERYLDNSFDLVARIRAAREQYQRELEAFGDVSEYEIRKIYGQRTGINYDDVEKTAQNPNKVVGEDREFVADEHQSRDAEESDRRQSTFDFTPENNAGQPQREVK